MVKGTLTQLKQQLTHLGDVGNQLSAQLDPAASTAVGDRKTKLDDRAAELQSRLQQQCDRLESTMDERSKFAEKCRVVETFLAALPARESRLSAAVSIPVVEQGVAAAKDLLVKIESVQPEVTRLNELGSELSLSDDDVRHLAELNSRWETTCADRVEEERRLEERLAQLQDWTDRCQQWAAFVTGVESETAQLPVGSYESLLEEQHTTEVAMSDSLLVNI